MIEFTIPAISCGHCARSVTEAVHEVDPWAEVEVDVAAKRVSVRTEAARDRLAAVLSEAGYPPAG